MMNLFPSSCKRDVSPAHDCKLNYFEYMTRKNTECGAEGVNGRIRIFQLNTM